jgi:hypothetical protein
MNRFSATTLEKIELLLRILELASSKKFVLLFCAALVTLHLHGHWLLLATAIISAIFFTRSGCTSMRTLALCPF